MRTEFVRWRDRTDHTLLFLYIDSKMAGRGDLWRGQMAHTLVAPTEWACHVRMFIGDFRTRPGLVFESPHVLGVLREDAKCQSLTVRRPSPRL